MALLACAVTLAEPSHALGWRVFDVTVLAFTALTGPFGIVLAPIAGVVWWLRRDPQRLIALAILASGAVIQTIVLSLGLGSRSRMPLGASPALLIKILSRHVFLGVIEGVKHPLAQFTDQSLLSSAAIVAMGAAVLIWAFWVGPLELRAFLAFGLAIYAASLARPLVSVSEPQWEALFRLSGDRYSLFPMLVFLASLVRLLGAREWPLRWVAGATLLACSPGIARDWRMPAFEDFSFSAHARAFSEAPPGAIVSIPINPAGWKMQLVKH